MGRLHRLSRFVKFIHDTNTNAVKDKDSDDIQKSFSSYIKLEFMGSTSILSSELFAKYKKQQPSISEVEFNELFNDAKDLEFIREVKIEAAHTIIETTSRGRFFIDSNYLGIAREYVRQNKYIFPLIVSIIALAVSILH